MSVTVDVDVEARVAELVAARRPLLEQLVRQAVDAELVALVDAELDRAVERLAAQRTNGATSAAAQVVAAVPSGTAPPANEAQAREPCTVCGERPRISGRRLCGHCRHARDRERRAKPASADRTRPHRLTAHGLDAGPADHRGLTPDELTQRVRVTRRVRGKLEPAELAQWLIDGGLADEHDGMLRPTVRGRELGTGLER